MINSNGSIIFNLGSWYNGNYGSGAMSFLPLTPANFEQHKKRIIKIIEDIKIKDLSMTFELSLSNGVLMGNHASDCDSCNILHYLMAFVINKHRLKVDT